MAGTEERKRPKKRPPEELVEMTHELSIPSRTWWGTEQRWLDERENEEEERVFRAYRRQLLRLHLVLYIGVAGFAILWSLFPGGVPSWAIYPLLAWGIGVAAHIWAVSKNQGDEYERSFQRWRFHRQMAHKRERR
jgi:hypothetical protein